MGIARRPDVLCLHFGKLAKLPGKQELVAVAHPNMSQPVSQP